MIIFQKDHFDYTIGGMMVGKWLARVDMTAATVKQLEKSRQENLVAQTR